MDPQERALPTPLGYIPQATIGNLIYTGGGSTWDGTTLQDSTISLVYDPVGDTIDNIAAIPRATGETRGLNFCNTMYVMGVAELCPIPPTRWTSTILWPIAGRLAHRSRRPGATSRPTPTVLTTYFCQAVTLPTVLLSWTRWKSSPVR